MVEGSTLRFVPHGRSCRLGRFVGTLLCVDIKTLVSILKLKTDGRTDSLSKHIVRCVPGSF